MKMNVYLCILGIVSALVLVSCELPPELKTKFEECGKEVGVSEDILKGPPNLDDPNVKCLVACIMKKEGSLVDGKIMADKLLELAAKYFPNANADFNKTDFTECTDKANEEKDECDVSGEFVKCIKEKHPHFKRDSLG